MLMRNKVLTVVLVTASKCRRQGAWRALQHLHDIKDIIRGENVSALNVKHGILMLPRIHCTFSRAKTFSEHLSTTKFSTFP